uniref:Uncharacterized protein n=1 Tax=viral metagenome TaxID=1070528 RepID=A0A6C0I2S3_9ZZZZ
MDNAYTALDCVTKAVFAFFYFDLFPYEEIISINIL